jgi:DNA-directed RNA polymerase subunit RPC12/RpoP
MPHFRCTSCHRSVESPVVIGAGDCPYCGGDVVFDVERGRGGRPDAEADAPQRGGRLRELIRRLRRR